MRGGVGRVADRRVRPARKTVLGAEDGDEFHSRRVREQIDGAPSLRLRTRRCPSSRARLLRGTKGARVAPLVLRVLARKPSRRSKREKKPRRKRYSCGGDGAKS